MNPQNQRKKKTITKQDILKRKRKKAIVPLGTMNPQKLKKKNSFAPLSIVKKMLKKNSITPLGLVKEKKKQQEKIEVNKNIDQKKEEKELEVHLQTQTMLKDEEKDEERKKVQVPAVTETLVLIEYLFTSVHVIKKLEAFWLQSTC